MTKNNPDERPEIDADIGDLNEITNRVLNMLVASNAHEPRLFIHGNVLVRLEAKESGRLRPKEVTAERLRYEMGTAARFTKKYLHSRTIHRRDVPPPTYVARNVLATPSLPFPQLVRRVEVPVFVSEDRLISTPGYDRDTGLYLDPYDNEAALSWASLDKDLTAARALIDDMLADFPFAGEADRSHAVALMFVPFVRDLIEGPVPLHIIEATTAGSGKTLLAQALLHPAVGSEIGIIAEARDDDELRKRITALLRQAASVALFDNQSRALDSGTFAAVLTARQWEDRLLGKNDTVCVPMRTIFVSTGNNPVLSTEIVRRSVRIRLDPKMDRPWQREGFRHPDLRRWVSEHRPVLIKAILTIVQAWLDAGRPAPACKNLGAFESWTQVVGGVVTFAGYKGFLDNAMEFYAMADAEGAVWRDFIERWWTTYHGAAVSVKELFEIAVELDGLYLGRGSSERGMRTVLGQQLKKRRDQIIGSYRIEQAGTASNAKVWRLRVFAEQDANSAEEIEVVNCQ